MRFFVQPIERWQHELSKVSKSGLLELIDDLTAWRGYDRDWLLSKARQAKTLGRYHDVMTRLERWKTDPEAAAKAHIGRAMAAKKAARSRKRTRNPKKGSSR